MASLRLHLLLVSTALLSSCANPSSEIWIGIRSDGNRGKGTRASPYDGSTTEKFDAILSRLWQNRVENITINILPGTYSTVGNGGYIPGYQDLLEGWRCHSGWHIRGAGKDQTRLILSKIYQSPFDGLFGGVIIATTDSSVSHVTVENLTLDCNHSKIGNKKSTEAGVALSGTHHTIRNVRVVNVAGLGYEAFPIAIGSNNLDSFNNLIEFCEIRDWHGGTGGSITISNNNNNQKPPITWTTGIVRNNSVSGTHIGYGGWGMKGVVFSNNTAQNCTYAVNIDSLNNSSVVFNKNQFLKCTSYGMVFANCHKFLLQNNTITLKPGAGPFLFLLENNSDFDVRSNTFKAPPGNSPSIAATRHPDTLRGQFIFSSNSCPPGSKIDLPPHLLSVTP